MKEFFVDVVTPDGEMECFAVHPDDVGSFPAVILYMDMPGIREELYEFTRKIAAQGYFCLLPDMFYREGKIRFDLSKGREEIDKMFVVGRTLNHEKVMRDTKGMLAYLDAQEVVKGPTGCVGYCMSGRYVVGAAGTYPDQFAAIASLYGVGIVTEEPDSPHLLADKIKGELYLGFAAEDPFVGPEVIPDLKKALDNYKVPHVIEVHPDTEHGFCFPERPCRRELSGFGTTNVAATSKLNGLGILR